MKKIFELSNSMKSTYNIRWMVKQRWSGDAGKENHNQMTVLQRSEEWWKLTDAENGQEDEIDDELSESGLHAQFLVVGCVLRLAGSPQSCTPFRQYIKLL